MSLRFRNIMFGCGVLAVAACTVGSGSETPDEQVGVSQVQEGLILSENANCKVEVTKIDYNQPGTDNADFIELKITKKQPGLVSTLLDCGIGAIATYDDSSLLCLVPSSLTVLATIVVPADGYIEIGQNQSTVAVNVGSSSQGWLNNTRGEIALLNTALPNGIPVAWLQYGGAAKCNLLSAPVTQVQAEGDTAPNYVNVSCDNTFHLVLATNAVQKTTADCPASGGAGGAAGSGGAAGLINLGGTGGLLNLGGLGGLPNLGGFGGLNLGGFGGLNLGGFGGLNLGGFGGLINIGGNAGAAGLINVGGNGGTGGLINVGGTSGNGGESANGGASANGGSGGEAGDPVAEGGKGNEAGSPSKAGSGNTGNESAGGEAGDAPIARAGRSGGNSSPEMVAEGGGCSCSVPNAGSNNRTQALAVLGVALGLGLRRRRARSN